MQARRLKSRQQFQAVLAGEKVARTEHFVMHRLLLESPDTVPASESGASGLFADGGSWLGVMVPKRWARRAVTRNLIKRQIYGFAMQSHSDLPAAAYLVRLYRGFDSLLFRSAASSPLRVAIHAEIGALFNKSAQFRALS